MLNIPKAIYLYDEGIDRFSFKQAEDFIRKNFGRIPVRLIRLKQKVAQGKGMLFDFLKTQEAFEKLKTARIKDACHIIFTSRLFATYDETKRLHIRSAIFGFPSVISTSGIVEGPAKPKEYYQYKQRYLQLGAWQTQEPLVKKKLKNRFIDYGDRRMAGVLKGYLAQGIFFYLTGEPFCGDKACRLFNAHWQEDLIYSQLKSKKFCIKHKKIIKEVFK